MKKRLIDTIVVDNNTRLNIATIESYYEDITNEQNPITLITTISGKIYRFLGTIEILEETLKIS
jgi:hypothetical protein